MTQRIIDLSHPIDLSTPPWPGSPAVEVTSLDRAALSRPAERHCNSSRFSMNIHCGTHMDAPFHFLDGGRTIDQIPLEMTFGPATLIRVPAHGRHQHIGADDLRPWAEHLRRTGKAIVQTGWAGRWGQDDFFTDYPDVTTDAAEFLVECGVHLIGVETGSVDYPPNDTHVVLLGNDVIIVECLTNLDQIEGDEFLFSALPLNLAGRDGSPVRAAAVVNE